MAEKEKKTKKVKPASFESVEKPIEPEATKVEGPETLGLLMDVELELTAQLGACEIPVRKVLDFTKGTVIELDAYTSKPIDLLANGRVIAKGEVVIIQDNFGLRITNVSDEKEIINPN